MPWAQLVRLPNVFTVLADVGAAYLLVAGGPLPASRLVCVLGAGVCLYWAGMILNDVFDVQTDRQQRPSRPIPSGQISLQTAKSAAYVLMGLGVLLATASGWVALEMAATTWLPGAVAIVLAIAIVLYDGPLKSTPLAPPMMGTCRVLSFLLGASPMAAHALESQDFETVAASGLPFPSFVLAAAIGFGIYVTGVTLMARGEAVGGRRGTLVGGLALIALGGGVLGWSPSWAAPAIQNQWYSPAYDQFAFLIAVVLAPVLWRGIRAVMEPQPRRIQVAIKIAVLTIIPLAATFAFLGAGPIWGLCIFLLAVPALTLGHFFRVT